MQLQVIMDRELPRLSDFGTLISASFEIYRWVESFGIIMLASPTYFDLPSARCSTLEADLSSAGPIRTERSASILNDDDVSRLLCLDSIGGDRCHHLSTYPI